MTEGAWILTQVRESLPPRLQPLWQFGLTIMLAVGSLFFLAFQPGLVADYFRIFGFAMGVYIVVICVQIARVNWALRRRLDQLSKGTDDLKTAKMMPTHILVLAVSTILSVVLHMSVMVAFYGEAPVLSGLFPYFVCVVFMLKVLGLNIIWRFVLIRREETARGAT